MQPYHCAERYGLVWLCLGEPRARIPEIAHESDPSFRRINTPVEMWKVSATRMVDNFLDITHFPYVHTGTFGRAQDTQVPKLEMQQLDEDFFGYRYEVIANNRSVGTIASGNDEPVVHRAMSSGFNLPFTCRSTIRYDSGLEHILLLLSTPIDDVTSYFTFVVWRNDDFSVAADEVIQLDLAIGAEDKVMLERLGGVLPLDQTTLVSVQADKCSVEWRRQLGLLLGA
jgi:phenylpropionate dioxygenase-like ring-hydroxylating dioxygenase large terminal subunit